MSDSVDFNQLVDDIVRSGNLASVRPVVEKELLHYDILYALANAGFLKSLIFQGARRCACATALTASARTWTLREAVISALQT